VRAKMQLQSKKKEVRLGLLFLNSCPQGQYVCDRLLSQHGGALRFVKHAQDGGVGGGKLLYFR
jgi:hypothetical protein